jgi:hypothetical protein
MIPKRYVVIVAGLLLLGLGFAAGAYYGVSTKGWNSPLPADRLLDRRSENGPTPLRIAEIVLERKGCLGTCPIYTIILRSDRTAWYIGKRHAVRMGKYYANAPMFERLAAYLEMQHFNSFADEYGNGIYDAGVATTSIVIDGKRKSVTASSPAEPTELWVIDALIDGIAASLSWEKQE